MVLSRPGLKALRLKLLYDLWLREDRVYAHLHKALEEEHPGVEYEVSRARDAAHLSDVEIEIIGLCWALKWSYSQVTYSTE